MNVVIETTGTRSSTLLAVRTLLSRIEQAAEVPSPYVPVTFGHAEPAHFCSLSITLACAASTCVARVAVARVRRVELRTREVVAAHGSTPKLVVEYSLCVGWADGLNGVEVSPSP